MAEALQDMKEALQLLRSLQHELKTIDQDLALLHHASLVANATCSGLCSFVQLRLQALENQSLESPPETPRAPVTARAPFGWGVVNGVEEDVDLGDVPMKPQSSTVKEDMGNTD